MQYIELGGRRIETNDHGFVVDPRSWSRYSDTAAVHAQTTTILSDVALLEAASAEPTGVPTATASPLTKLATLYIMARNKKTVTATKKTYFGDDDLSEFEGDVSDDGTTYTESEVNAV